MHVIVDDLDAAFTRMKQVGLQPFEHTSPGDVLDAPVVKPWGEREFELQDPDGQRWAFNERSEK